MSYREVGAQRHLFVVCEDSGSLFALDPATGEIAWKNHDVGRAHAGAIVSDGQRVIVAGGGRLVCIDAGSGATRWIAEPDLGRCPALIVEGDRIFVGSASRVFCFMLDGQCVWCKQLTTYAVGAVSMALGDRRARVHVDMQT